MFGVVSIFKRVLYLITIIVLLLVCFLFSLFRTLTIPDRAREWPLTGPLRRGALSQYGYWSRVIVQFV